MTLQALVAKVTTTLSSDSSGSLLPKSLQHFPQLQISHATQLQHNTTCRSVVDTYFLTLTTLVKNSIAYAYHMPHTKLSVEVLHPSSALWYLPNICSLISQDCLCNSASKSMRLSFNIAMMSRWLRVIRTSSNSGMSHSRSTIKVCTNLKILVTLSNPIIQPMIWSCTASCKGRVLVRLSIQAQIWRNSLITNTPVPNMVRWLPNQNSHSSISRQVVGVLIVQTPHLCLQDLLPTSACQSSQLTYFSLFISRQVVGVFIVQTPHLCLQDLLPTSACRDILKHSKTCRYRQSIDKSLYSNDLTANMPKRSETKTRHLNQEYSSSSMPLTLHQQCTNPVSTANP